MVEVTVKLEYKGKNYLTNVIANKNTPEKQIQKNCTEQIEKQW